MKLHLKWVTRDLRGRTRDLYTLLITEMKKSRLEISVTKESKEGNSKMEVSNPCLIRRLDLICKEECLSMGSSLEDLGMDKRTSSRMLGKMKSRDAWCTKGELVFVKKL